MSYPYGDQQQKQPQQNNYNARDFQWRDYPMGQFKKDKETSENDVKIQVVTKNGEPYFDIREWNGEYPTKRGVRFNAIELHRFQSIVSACLEKATELGCKFTDGTVNKATGYAPEQAVTPVSQGPVFTEEEDVDF